MKSLIYTRFISVIAWVMVTMVIVGITLYQLRFWLGGPSLEIDTNEFTTSTGFVEIVFVVSNTEEVLINGSGVVPQVGGRIEKNLRVNPGKNIVSIDLYDKYSAHKREYLYIEYPQDSLLSD